MNPSRLAVVLPFLCLPAFAQDGYRKPPQVVVDCLEAAPPPSVSVSPDRTYLVLRTRESMPSIAVQSRPILRLAGSRIDPATRGRQRGARSTGLELLEIADGTRRPIAVPDGADIGSPIWTADGSRMAFTNTTDDAIELWVADVTSGKARRVDGVRLNGTTGSVVRWMPDQKTLLCRLVTGNATPPTPPRVPTRPVTQENLGVTAPVRTYQDLLKNEYDEALFDYYMTSQLATVDPDSGAVAKIGEPGIFTTATPSPDAKYLLVTRVERPYSYLVTARSFPRRIAVTDMQGGEVFVVAEQPLADTVPIGGVEEGPRSVQWVPTADHTLLWAEALDGGNPRNEAKHRDRVMVHTPPQRSAPMEWLRLEHRYSGASFADGGELALVSETDRFRTRQTRTWKAQPRQRDAAPELLIERSTQDSYGNPGRPMFRVDERGSGVMRVSAGHLFFAGSGATPQGDRPFLDLWHLESGEKKRVFRCADNVMESVVTVLTDDGSTLLIRRESKTEPPNYFVRDAATGKDRALTDFEDPVAVLTAGIQKEMVHYERADGIPLSATLYLPPDYRKGDRLPLLVWAYPREFNSRKNAGQVRGSPHRYTRLSGTSPLLLTLCGYAVMNNAAMPVVGPVETANDTFIDQLVSGAKAAIDKAVEMGVADPERTAIAGHSYGAFMTANLLAHSDLFRAGVARSGAYNRSLTPFGFQNERRTFWEAPEIYFAMSPFMHAPKIDEPLLLIHGEMDNNSGTFPIQSRRLYHAVKGHGGTIRLVMLPYESHGYRARESVMHCMAETVDWLDKYVKNAKPRAAEAAGTKKGAR